MCQASFRNPDKVCWLFCWLCVHYRSYKLSPQNGFLGCGHTVAAVYDEPIQFKSTDEFEAWIINGGDPSAPCLTTGN